MAEVTALAFEEVEAIYDGIARRARAALGVTSFGMQVMTLRPDCDGYPDHHHDATVADADQEEVYVPLAGSGALLAGACRARSRPRPGRSSAGRRPCPPRDRDPTREAELVAAARAGDERAFVALTATHRPALHAHCNRLLSSLHDAADPLQETLLRAWRGLDGFEPHRRDPARHDAAAGADPCLAAPDRDERVPAGARAARAHPCAGGCAPRAVPG